MPRKNQFPMFSINTEVKNHKNVKPFTYLGSNASLDYEIINRIACQLIFLKFRHRHLDDRDITLGTKIKAYKAVVLNTIMYGSESYIDHILISLIPFIILASRQSSDIFLKKNIVLFTKCNIRSFFSLNLK